MGELVFKAAVCTDRGNYRSGNEDNYALNGGTLPPHAMGGRFTQEAEPSESIVCGVFDGIGGEMYGEKASRICAERLPKYEKSVWKRGADGFRVFAVDANTGVCSEIHRCGHVMGTTAVVLAASDLGVTAYNVGDSRSYVWRDGALTQMSKDHTETQALVDSGRLSPEQAALDPRRHRLSQCIGISPEERDIFPFESLTLIPRAGDRYLLCSDGVSDVLPAYRLAQLLGAQRDPQSMAQSIVQLALDSGSKDNCTALVVQASATGRGAKAGGRTKKRGGMLWFLSLLTGFLAGMSANLLLHILRVL